ncbi:MAG: hypothetical protein HC915_15815, partial [Anaerolineae bacterium]|nr:hypothetical protein [Anaerolineae bacterium]
MLDERLPLGQAQETIDKHTNRERQQFIALLVLFVVVAILIGALYLIQATTNVSNARDIQNLREQRAAWNARMNCCALMWPNSTRIPQ